MIVLKVMVCGAGIQGSYMASHLHEKGVDVTLLARGSKLEDYEQNGIRIAYHPSDTIETYRVPLACEVEPEEEYDIYLILMQKQQAKMFAETLGEVISDGTAVFLGNNGTGIRDYEKHIIPEQILLGFFGVAGYRESNHIRLLKTEPPPIWIGAPTEESEARLEELVALLNRNGFSPTLPESIDGWLKCHLALILPLAGAIYGANADNYKFANTPALINLSIKGLKEAFYVIRKVGIKPEPRRYRLMARFPDWMLRRIFRQRMATRESEISLAGHARAARAEMQGLADEFQILVNESQRPTPAYDKLVEYINSEDLLVEKGAKVI